MKKLTGNKIVLILFIICCFALFLIWQQFNIFNFDPWNTWWYDEMMYYKQLESIATFWAPRGYFGYDGSHALVGGFGAWVPIMLYLAAPFYALFKEIGVYLFNFLILILSFGFLYYANRKLSIKHLLALTLPVISVLIIRYAISGMFETFFTACTIIVFACYLCKTKKSYYIIGLIMIALLTMHRPYLALLFIPYCIDLKNINKKDIFIGVLGIAISILAYFMIVYFFCASASNNPKLVLLDLFSNVDQGIFNFIKLCIVDIFTAIYDRLYFIAYTLIYNRNALSNFGASITYILYFLTGLTYTIIVIKQIIKHKLDNSILVLFIMIAMFIATCWLNNDPQAGSRHVFTVMLFAWLYLLNEYYNSLPLTISFIVVLLISNLFIMHDQLYKMPTNDNSAYIDENMNTLVLSDNYAENTIVHEYGGDYWTYLAFKNLPAGFGVNVYSDAALQAKPNLDYKYTLIANNSINLNYYENSNDFELIFSNDIYRMYINKKYK